MGRTETDRKITSEPWSSMHRGQQSTRKTTLRSEGTRAFKKYLTEPTLLEISGKRGGLNWSTQHSARARLALKTKIKALARLDRPEHYPG